MTDARRRADRALAARVTRTQLLQQSASRRVPYLIEQQNTRELVRRLLPQDLLVAVHAHGAGDSLELLELLPPSQVQSFIDLEAWRKDRLNPRAMTGWLSLLYAANADRALAQVMGLDAELITLFLKLHTRVFDLGQETVPEPVPEDAIVTPDNRYLVVFVTPPHPDGRDQPDPTDVVAVDVTRRIVAGLIAREPFTAARYLEAVRWELPSELEEASLRWRQGRLADLGFYELYEAVGLYTPTDLSRPPRPRGLDHSADSDGPDGALSLFVDEYTGAPLLRAATEQLSELAADRLRRQMVALSNRVAAAQGLSPGDLEALATAVVETASTTNLGLEFLSRGDMAAAGSLLAEVAVADIFRTGFTLAWQLGQKAGKVRARLMLRPDRSLLPAGVDDLFDALCQRIPKLYAGLFAPERSDRIPFETLAQLARAAEVVAESAFLAALLTDVLRFDLRRVPELVGPGCNILDDADMSLDLVLATALCRASAGGVLDPAPLDADELAAVRALCRRDDTELRHGVAHQIEENAAPRCPLPGAPTAEIVTERARVYSERLCARIYEEIGAVREEIDARFVTTLLCKLDDT